MATKPSVTVGDTAVSLITGLTAGNTYEAQLVEGDLIYLYDGAAAPDPLIYDIKYVTPKINGGVFALKEIDATEPTWAWAAPGCNAKVSIADA